MTEKLKPCPFCGGEAELVDWLFAFESGTIVKCKTCGVRMAEGVEDGDGYHERAVKKWNRRDRND